MAGDKHARAAETRIAGILKAKWVWQYSQMASFVQTRMRMCLAIVRSNTDKGGDESTSSVYWAFAP